MSERSDWLMQRTYGLGGIDSSAILRLNPWRGPLDVFLEKTRRSKPWDVEPERVKWGRILQEPIARGYAEAMDLGPGELIEPGLLHHSTVDCILGTPDYMYTSQRRGVEIKAVNPFAKSDYGEEGTDAIPDHYHLQGDHYLFLTDFDEWDFPILFGGQHLGIYTVKRNPRLDDILAEACARFWRDYIVADKMPPVDDSERYGEFLADAFRNSTSKLVLNATDEFLDWLERIREAKRVLGLAAKVKQEARNHIMNILGADFKGMKAPDGAKAQWIRPKDGSETDWEAIAKTFHPDPELVKAHTKTKERDPYLRVTFPDEEESEISITAGHSAKPQPHHLDAPA